MADPIRPSLIDLPTTDHTLSVTYRGPMADCLALYERADDYGIDASVTANSNRQHAEVTISSMSPAKLSIALEGFEALHADAVERGLTK